MPDNLTAALRLVLVTDDDLMRGRDPIALATAAVRGGVTAIQLRLKHGAPRAMVELLLQLRAAVPVPLFVNDRPDVAAAADVGVHLGPDDMAPELARRVLGSRQVIGASVGNEGELARGTAADYWGIGPWRATTTKGDAGAPLGPAGFRTIAMHAGSRPRVAIGGVRPEDIISIFESGGTGVAVVSGLLAVPDIVEAARRYREALDVVGPVSA